MKVSYGLVFYFAVAMVIASVGLIFLIAKPIRHLVMGICKRIRIGEGIVFTFTFWVLFTLICAILLDAVLSFLALRDTLDISNNAIYSGSQSAMVDNFDTIKPTQNNDYIIVFKQYRDYYMSERNFMLTASTLFIMLVFDRFFRGIRKLYEIEISGEAKTKTN